MFSFKWGLSKLSLLKADAGIQNVFFLNEQGEIQREKVIHNPRLKAFL